MSGNLLRWIWRRAGTIFSTVAADWCVSAQQVTGIALSATTVNAVSLNAETATSIGLSVEVIDCE